MVVKVLCSQNQLSYKYKNTFNCKVYCHKWQCQVPCVSAACPPAQKQNTDFPITGNAFSKCKSSTVFWVWDSITKILCMNFMIFLSGTTKNNQLTLFWHKFFFFFQFYESTINILISGKISTKEREYKKNNVLHALGSVPVSHHMCISATGNHSLRDTEFFLDDLEKIPHIPSFLLFVVSLHKMKRNEEVNLSKCLCYR